MTPKAIEARLARLESQQVARLEEAMTEWPRLVIDRLQLTNPERAVLAGYVRRLATDRQALPEGEEQGLWSRVKSDSLLWNKWLAFIAMAEAMTGGGDGRLA